MAAGSLKRRARGLLRPFAQHVAALGVPPAAFTFAGLVLSALAGVGLGTGWFRLSGILLALAGVCDMVDGATARAGNRTSRSGAFLDSTIDRYSEIVVLLGALHYYLARSTSGPEVGTAALIFLALSGSLMVSYVRARAEGEGQRCDVGLAERAERLIILIVGALLGPGAFRIAIWILAILSHVTAIQRIGHVLARMKD
jgi:CDP-diacylglycerol--glycerol-3-phosphate 3-phosphatidyltransferase